MLEGAGIALRALALLEKPALDRLGVGGHSLRRPAVGVPVLEGVLEGAVVVHARRPQPTHCGVGLCCLVVAVLAALPLCACALQEERAVSKVANDFHYYYYYFLFSSSFYFFF